MSWIVLIAAGTLETVWAGILAQPEFWRRPLLLLGFLVAMTASMGGLAYGLREVPVGTGYAVWTGVGATTTALVGILAYGDPATAGRLVSIGLILAGIVGLKLAS